MKEKLRKMMIEAGAKKGWVFDYDDNGEVAEVRSSPGNIATMSVFEYCVCKTLWWKWHLWYNFIECFGAMKEGLIALAAFFLYLVGIVLFPISAPIAALAKIKHEIKYCDRHQSDWREHMTKRADKYAAEGVEKKVG